MTKIEQVKQYLEERLKAHEEQVDVFHDDVVLMGMIHEDKIILYEIEEIMNSRDTIESDN